MRKLLSLALFFFPQYFPGTKHSRSVFFTLYLVTKKEEVIEKRRVNLDLMLLQLLFQKLTKLNSTKPNSCIKLSWALILVFSSSRVNHLQYKQFSLLCLISFLSIGIFLYQDIGKVNHVNEISSSPCFYSMDLLGCKSLL